MRTLGLLRQQRGEPGLVGGRDRKIAKYALAETTTPADLGIAAIAEIDVEILEHKPAGMRFVDRTAVHPVDQEIVSGRRCRGDRADTRRGQRCAAITGVKVLLRVIAEDLCPLRRTLAVVAGGDEPNLAVIEGETE